MPELPRLNDLGWAATDDLGAIAMHDRILDRDAWYGSIPQETEKAGSLLHLQPTILVKLPSSPAGIQPPDAAVGEVGARRMGNHEVEGAKVNVLYVTFDMRSGSLRWQNVTTYGIVAACNERIADDARKLTGDEDFHEGPL